MGTDATNVCSVQGQEGVHQRSKPETRQTKGGPTGPHLRYTLQTGRTQAAKMATQLSNSGYGIKILKNWICTWMREYHPKYPTQKELIIMDGKLRLQNLARGLDSARELLDSEVLHPQHYTHVPPEVTCERPNAIRCYA